MILDKIVAQKRLEVAESKARKPLDLLAEEIESAPPPHNFRDALRRDGISLIAEIKRRSPSRGDILPGVDPVELAALYEQSGARALSILTDGPFFGGSLEDLAKVRRSSAIPCLRKEFIIDPYQLHEARAAGADALLLIVRILDDALLRDLIVQTRALGMEALVETHTEEEVGRALEAGARIVGINNRNLDTLEVDVQTTMRLKRLVPGGYTLVSESGIHHHREVRILEDCGVDAVLVGESLLTSGDIHRKVRELLCDDPD